MLFAAAGLFVGLVLIAFSLAAASGQAETYAQETQRRLERDAELQMRYWDFIDTHGRVPTTRELWDSCPPA